MAVVPPTATTPASLYVGDLHPDVTDGELFDAFSEFKSLASVRVCKDSTTGRSTCYGYANFLSPHDAIRAIEVKNHTQLHGKMLRISWSCRDPDARKSGVANLFVKTEESANAAIENLNGTTVGDKRIYVGRFIKKSDRVLPSPAAKYTNLFMKNLDSDVTEEHLVEKFSKFGKIASLLIARDENGTSRGFGFVNFDNPDDARRALEAMNGSVIGSKVLYVARAQKKAEREQILRHQFEEKRKERILKYKGSNVYVKNIDDDVTDEELKAHFSQCGTITSAKVMRDEKGINKGFGFVCFSSPEEASKAVNTFHGYMLHRKPLYVAIAQRKEDRQAHLQLQYAQHMAGIEGSSANVIPSGYPSLYYTTPPGIVSQVPPRPGLMYQPLGLRTGWRANGFVPPTRPAFHVSPLPVNPKHNRQNRGRMNGNMLPQVGAHYMQQSSQSAASSKDSSNQQKGGQSKYVPNGRIRELNKGSGVSLGTFNSGGVMARKPDMLNGMLAAASPEQQKQILGERLYPLVEKHEPDLVAKITGMLLEMDNSELLLLLESPESLAVKVEEAVQVLKLSEAKVSTQEAIHPNYLSAEVAVN
ncbi:hypothetical protein CUMW_006780 [Citrus unshiu]|nr:hypothetical protein CUMW_006780 [Citrus unshiu]